MNVDREALDPWVEWKRLCALGRCTAPTQTTLRDFVTRRFSGLVQRYHFQTNVPGSAALTLLPTDPWHLLETHLTINQTGSGKRYKDWLFAWAAQHHRGGVAAIENGVCLLLRDVVREYLRREFFPARVLSLSQPLAGTDGEHCLEDLLPGQLDPAAEIERREFERQAQARAQIAWPELSPRERVALLAKDLGLSLAHPLVLEITGCGKSMVNQAYRELVRRLATRLSVDYADDDRAAIVTLTIMTLHELHHLSREWGKSENQCRPLFDRAEGYGER